MIHSQVRTAVVFTNTSDRTCAVTGWPGVSRRDAAGAVMGADAVRSPANESSAGEQAPTIELGPGGQASALVRAETPAYHDPDRCGPTLVPTSLRIYPPDLTSYVDLPYRSPVCASGVGEFDVVWVVAGDDPGDG